MSSSSHVPFHRTAARRVAWVTPAYPPEQGGVSDHSSTMVSVLRTTGHDVLVCSAPHERGLTRLHADLAAYGPDLVIVAYTPLGYAPHSGGIAPAFTLWSTRLRKRLGCQAVLLAHEVSLPAGSLLRDGEFKLASLGAAQAAQFAILASNFDVVLFSNAGTQRSWAKHVPRLANRFHTLRICSNIPVHSSVDPTAELIAAGYFVPSPTILFFGTGHPSVLFDYVEAAFRALLEVAPNAGLVIVGMDHDKLRQLCPTLAVQGFPVQALGHIAAPQVSLWLQVAELVLAPLVEGVSARKGTVMAAMQHARAVVTTRGERTLDDIAWADTCILAPVDRQAFAEAAVEAFRDPARRLAIGRSARLEYDMHASATVTAMRILDHANRVGVDPAPPPAVSHYPGTGASGTGASQVERLSKSPRAVHTPEMAGTSETMQHLYAEFDGAVRPAFGNEAARARDYYRRYVDFVTQQLPNQPARVLDIGSGAGWSTLMMREAGHDAHGLDLHPSDRVEVRSFADIPYTQGDAQHLPFPDGSFDAVAMYQVLEHVPKPELALRESMRVLRPGGRLFVVGPNLLGAGPNLYWSVRHTLRCLRQGKVWESRTEDMARHPGGNTMPEAWLQTLRYAKQTLQKLTFERSPTFLMREPDPRPPFHADNDACYFCNPMDLFNWATATGLAKPVRWWALDRNFARVVWPITGGTWVVLEKR